MIHVIFQERRHITVEPLGYNEVSAKGSGKCSLYRGSVPSFYCNFGRDKAGISFVYMQLELRYKGVSCTEKCALLQKFPLKEIPVFLFYFTISHFERERELGTNENNAFFMDYQAPNYFNLSMNLKALFLFLLFQRVEGLSSQVEHTNRLKIYALHQP